MRGIICEPCGCTEFKPTKYRDVYGLGTDLVECRGCGTCRYNVIPPEGADAEAFCNSQAAHDSIDRDYRNGASNNPDPARREEYIAFRETYYRHMLWQIGWLLKTRIESIYEIGTAYGDFLVAAQALGVPRIGGCDINRRGAELATERLGSKVDGCAWQKSPVAGRYDSIVMLDYIEHTLTPYADLLKARFHLCPDGILLLKTFLHEWHEGQELVLTRDEFSKGYNHKRGYFDPYCHHWHFTRHSLLQLLERSGFVPLHVSYEDAWGQITIYAQEKSKWSSGSSSPG